MKRLPINLADPFGSEQTKVLEPVLVCNSTSKNGSPVRDPQSHLVCFKVRRRKIRQLTFATSNDFGAGAVTVRRTELLCTPASSGG